mmetsp:Transcript_35626/g.80002  ORF Transcript_35626/g.80002 Transcript_35626/m.80002 type:complete len:219 (-) Transcript_35626:577-1233(-)
MVPSRAQHFDVRVDEHEHLSGGNLRAREARAGASLAVVVPYDLHLRRQRLDVIPLGLVDVLSDVLGKVMLSRNAVVVHDDDLHEQVGRSPRKDGLDRDGNPVLGLILSRHDYRHRRYHSLVESVMVAYWIEEVLHSSPLVQRPGATQVPQKGVLFLLLLCQVSPLERVVRVVFNPPRRGRRRFAAERFVCNRAQDVIVRYLQVMVLLQSVIEPVGHSS